MEEEAAVAAPGQAVGDDQAVGDAVATAVGVQTVKANRSAGTGFRPWCRRRNGRRGNLAVAEAHLGVGGFPGWASGSRRPVMKLSR